MTRSTKAISRLLSLGKRGNGRRVEGARPVRRRRRRFSKFHRRRRRHRAVLLRPRLRLRRPRVFFTRDDSVTVQTIPVRLLASRRILHLGPRDAPRDGDRFSRRDHPRSRLRVVRLRPRSDVPRRRGGLEPRRPGRRCRSGRRPRGDGSRGGSGSRGGTIRHLGPRRGFRARLLRGGWDETTRVGRIPRRLLRGGREETTRRRG